ncbi:MAG: short-chain dehydrogenase [Crocosphaera sp.]
MYRKQVPSPFNTVEGYENFINRLLEKEQDVKVDPMLDWEDVMEKKPILTR